MGAPPGNQYAVGNKGGGVTKYTSKTLEQAEHYLENYEEYGDKIPSISGLALALDVLRACLYEWAKKENKKDFAYILKKIKEKQHSVLISKGLSGEFNSNICKLVLGKHGYHDKAKMDQKSEITGKDGGPVKWEINFKDTK